MIEWFNDLAVFDKVFLVCAVFGSLLFLIRMALLVFGVGDDDGGDYDVDLDGELDADGGDEGTSGFKLLSIQSITAFFMMFGFVGLAIHKGSGFHPVMAIIGAIVAGLFSSWVLSVLFGVFYRLQHTGTMRMKNAIGKEGKVYLTVPPFGQGKVEIVVQGRLMVLNAETEEEDGISTGSQVKVIGLVGTNTLMVSKL